MSAIPAGAYGAFGAAGAAAAINEAIKASGAIVQVEPEQFLRLLSQTESPLVVTAKTTFLRTRYKYLTSYKGLIFYAKSATPLELSMGVEVITAKKVSIPEY